MNREQVDKIEEACVLAMYSMVEPRFTPDTAEDVEKYRARAIAMYQGRRVKAPDYDSTLFHAKVTRLVATICDITTGDVSKQTEE